MAPLPDPLRSLSEADRAEYERMARVRGEGHLGEVYLRMWNNAAVARLVGQLGEHLRYHGGLPDDLRELVILYFARRTGLPYEWAHHERQARKAGVAEQAVADIAAGRIPASLTPQQHAALRFVDAVLDSVSVPEDAQSTIVDSLGTAAAVELVVLVGLYRLIGGVVTGFDVGIEPGLRAPF